MFGRDQLEYLLGWLQIAFIALVTMSFIPGQIPVFAGPANCGKTLIQTKIITPLLGGRDAKPYQYMTGLTQFNSDLFKGEHLIISDENPATRIEERRAFGAAIKNLIVEPKQRLHAKGKDAIMLEPFWRVSISINDEPENLMILPPLDDSVADKLMLFHVKRPDCLPDGENGSREKFGKAIQDELPAFAHYLMNEHEILPSMRGGRFGIKEYMNPYLESIIGDLSPEAALLSLVQQEVFSGAAPGDEWTWRTVEEAERSRVVRKERCRKPVQESSQVGTTARETGESERRVSGSGLVEKDFGRQNVHVQPQIPGFRPRVRVSER
jgi:hypothetical protein